MSETIEPYTFEEFVRRRQKKRALLGVAPMKVVRRGESTRTGTRVQFIRKPEIDSSVAGDSNNKETDNRHSQKS